VAATSDGFDPASRNSGLADLFRHVSAEKAALYRSVMETFAAAKRQFRLHMRPDEVLSEGRWDAPAPGIEAVQAALAQLTEWGNLESQPDTARVASISDFYRARFLYRLSQGGEAVEEALMTFERILRRRAELQTIALEDIANRLQALRALADEAEPDAAKSTRHCATWRGCSRAWPTTRRPSWRVSVAASSCNRPRQVRCWPTRRD
jgi:uncharacterized protein (TIGR02677 family)